jgi:hypothetical protein
MLTYHTGDNRIALLKLAYFQLASKDHRTSTYLVRFTNNGE